MEDYKKKYLEYKLKYIQLKQKIEKKNQIGGDLTEKIRIIDRYLTPADKQRLVGNTQYQIYDQYHSNGLHNNFPSVAIEQGFINATNYLYDRLLIPYDNDGLDDEISQILASVKSIEPPTKSVRLTKSERVLSLQDFFWNASILNPNIPESLATEACSIDMSTINREVVKAYVHRDLPLIFRRKTDYFYSKQNITYFEEIKDTVDILEQIVNILKTKCIEDKMEVEIYVRLIHFATDLLEDIENENPGMVEYYINNIHQGLDDIFYEFKRRMMYRQPLKKFNIN